jgi:hypothetical protein
VKFVKFVAGLISKTIYLQQTKKTSTNPTPPSPNKKICEICAICGKKIPKHPTPLPQNTIK